MSYDLTFLRPRALGALPSHEVWRYFEQRPHYRVDRAMGQAMYGNEQTGVYFAFDVGAPDEGDEDDLDTPDDGLVPAEVAFNLNYYCPHFFGLEAEPEVSAFVNHFALSVDDPQMEGMNRGDYSPEGFLKGWNAGNAFGYRAAAGQDLRPHTLPTAELERVWRWNVHTPVLSAQLGDEVFVPRIMAGATERGVETLVAWTDAIPVMLPRVDTIVFMRMRLARWGWFSLLLGRPEQVHVRWAEMADLLALAERRTDAAGGDYYLFQSPQALRRVEAFVRAQPKAADAMPVVSMDSILNRELVDGQRATNS